MNVIMLFNAIKLLSQTCNFHSEFQSILRSIPGTALILTSLPLSTLLHLVAAPTACMLKRVHLCSAANHAVLQCSIDLEALGLPINCVPR